MGNLEGTCYMQYGGLRLQVKIIHSPAQSAYLGMNGRRPHCLDAGDAGHGWFDINSNRQLFTSDGDGDGRGRGECIET